MIRHVLVVLLLLSVSVGEPTSEARVYLDTALDLLQEHSVESAKADWPALRGEAHRAVATTRTPSATHAAIEQVIKALGNPHTRLLRTPGGGPSFREVPGGRMIGSTAYLKLPRVSSDDGETYVNSGRYLLRPGRRTAVELGGRPARQRRRRHGPDAHGGRTAAR